MLFISKGAPYIKENKDGVWQNNRIIYLTPNQFLFWKFFYGEIKSYGQLMKYIAELCLKDIQITKDVMQQTILQLKTLDLLAYTDDDSKKGRFVMLFENNIIPVKKDGIKEDFDLKLYDKIKTQSSMSVADIIAEMDNLQYNELTNGHDKKYLEFVFNAVHAYAVETSVLRMIKHGNLCLY